MLCHLQIRNFAIVDQLELELSAGMSAITGETGAGKSIMVDALGLLLGDRGDSSVVRHGAERAEIAASFDISALSNVQNWLEERDLSASEECHIRRLINQNGRSRVYINGVSQPLQSLKTLGELLVDIHSQHEHQSLLKRELQRQLLDDYAAHQQAGHHHLLLQVSEAFHRWSELRQQLAELDQIDSERDARLALLKFQADELEALALSPDELPTLEDEHKKLANAGRLLDISQQALVQLYEHEEHSVHSQISRQLNELTSVAALDAGLSSSIELINNALIQTQEAGDTLRRYLQSIDLDPQRLSWVEQRLADIHQLARKHRLEPQHLNERLAQIRTEIEGLADSEQRRAHLEKDIATASDSYHEQAETLSQHRKTAAALLSQQISAAMQELGMAGGQFEARLNPLEHAAAYGLETIEFWVSANPGQPLKLLNRVASGGELSRISLAIQVSAADSTRIPTLIFDEVDSGIGGGVAEVVGRQLRALGSQRQVLCVTHLPQVAAQAHQQFRVQKQTAKNHTRTHVIALDQHERTAEVARMLGGMKLTKRTLEHARELIDQAQQS